MLRFTIAKNTDKLTPLTIKDCLMTSKPNLELTPLFNTIDFTRFQLHLVNVTLEFST